MTRKIIILLEIIFCVLAVVIISVIGNNPETWRDYQPVSSIEFVNSAEENNPFILEDGDKVVTISWKSDTVEIKYQLSWKILPDNATISEIDLTPSISNDNIVSINGDGLITFKNRATLLSNGFAITIKTMDKTEKTDTLYFDFISGGGGVVPPP